MTGAEEIKQEDTEEPSIEHCIMVAVSSFHELIASDNPTGLSITNAPWVAGWLARDIKEHFDDMMKAQEGCPKGQQILRFMLMVADIADDDSSPGEQQPNTTPG